MSLAPEESPTPPCLAYYTSVPLSSYFLSSCSLSFSVSLINVKASNNKASILSLPASSVPRICHCARPSPSANSATTIILSQGHRAETQAHTAIMKGCSEEAYKEDIQVRRRHFSHFRLFILWPRGKKRFHSLLHNSWNTQEKNNPLNGKKSLGFSSPGGVMGVCMPVFVSSDPSSLLLSIHHYHSHTYQHCSPLPSGIS